MNTDGELDRIVRGWLEGRVADPPSGGLRTALGRVADTPQERHRWGGWLSRARASSMSWDRRERKPLAAVAAAASAIAILLVAALVLPRLVTDRTHVVAGDGSGDFTSIAAAVAAAADGERILVQPGRYYESFIIDKDITLEGAGDSPNAVTIAVPDGALVPEEAIPRLDYQLEGPATAGQPPTGIQLLSTAATLRNLRVESGPDDLAILARGGSPSLERVVVFASDYGDECCVVLAAALFAVDGSDVLVRDSELWHRVVVDGGSRLTIEDSELVHPRIGAQRAASLELRGDRLSGADDTSVVVLLGSRADLEGNTLERGGVMVIGRSDDGTTATLESNTINNAPYGAIWVYGGASATIVDNTIRGSPTGILLSLAPGVVQGNQLVDNATGLDLSRTDASVTGNSVRGGAVGIRTLAGGSPRIEANTIRATTKLGISVGSGTSPAIAGNEVCGSGEQIFVHADASPLVGDNDICPAGAPGG